MILLLLTGKWSTVKQTCKMQSACFTENWQNFITNIVINKKNLFDKIIIGHGFLRQLYHKYFHKQKNTFKSNKHKPWLSHASKARNKNKDILYLKCNKNKPVTNEIKYKAYLIKLNSMLKFALRKYHSGLLDENKHTKTQQIIKNTVNRKIMKKMPT